MLDDLITVLREHEVQEALFNRICVAVSEAFTNAMVHGNRRDSGKIINVELEVNKSSVVADITDEGTGGIERIKTRRPANTMSEGGRGIDLIQHYASKVSFDNTNSGGLKVSISFDRNRENIVCNS